MNFARDSLKLRSKAQNEDFCFDTATAQGHFFAVLDFAPHDYANLNATLEGKLETVVGSFASLPKFSADLFLGFLAKEINNFLHHLSEQSSGPEILCSAALCLVDANRLSYLIYGDVRIDITGGRLLSLSGESLEASDASGGEIEKAEGETAADASANIEELDQLGTKKLEAPLTDRVKTFTLLDDDVVLIMTHGLEAGFDRRQLPRDLVGSGSPEPKLICEALMRASASSSDDRTVVVISGPYSGGADPVLSDLSKAIAALEARVNALSESDAARVAAAPVPAREATGNEKEQVTAQELEALKVELAAKAPKSDLLAFDGQLKTLSELLKSKADSAEVLGLKQDILKLGKAGAARFSTEESNESQNSVGRWLSSSIGSTLLLVLITAIAAAFIGAWLQSRVFKKNAEVWTVSTTGNQIVIRRVDGNGQEAQRTVSLNVAEPLNSTGEQTFSSFADVAQYIDRLAQPAPASSSAEASRANQPKANPADVTEVTVQQGDSLKKFAERYNVAAEKIEELNPDITRWTMIQIGQKIKVPSQPQASPAASPTNAVATPSTAANSGTIEVTLGPGDSLNRLVQRYKSTPDKLRELNPQITNWARIRAGHKVIVPAPSGG